MLFLSDIFPTGYMAAENCDIQPRRHVAVWGCGPVGLFAIQSAFLLGAERVIAIDRVPGAPAHGARRGKRRDRRLRARSTSSRRSRELTGGRGPDACIDAVGLEAHGTALDALYDRAKTSCAARDRPPHALRQAIHACRKGGTVSIPGVYGGFLDKFPIGAAFAKGLTLQDGPDPRAPLHAPAARADREGRDRPVVDHHAPPALDDAPEARDLPRKEEECIKVVLQPLRQNGGIGAGS